MTHHVEAIFENGVFRPVIAPGLADQTRVHLTVEPAAAVAAHGQQATAGPDGELAATTGIDSDGSDAPWMRFAGMVASGDPQSSQNIDDIVYGDKP